MTAHVVQQGDYLSKIATQYGISNWKLIWDHPDNLQLRNRRKNPGVLYPGDVLVIPDVDTKHVGRPTDQRHRFAVKRSELKLILVLERPYDTPLAHVECDHAVEGDSRPDTTDATGRLERQIPSAAQSAQVTLRNSQTALDNVPIPLRIGHLDPVDTTSGQSGRLNNLAYLAGPLQGCTAEENARLFDSAVQEFQCDHGLAVDGICGPVTRRKLEEVYGC